MKDNMTIVSDIFFVLSVIFLGFAGFGFLNKNQAFSGLGFGIQKFFSRIFSPKKQVSENYAEYLKNRQEKSRNRSKWWILIPLFAGLVFLAIAAVTSVIACNGKDMKI